MPLKSLKRRTLYAVVISSALRKQKVKFYSERSAAKKAARASLIRPGVVVPVTV